MKIALKLNREIKLKEVVSVAITLLALYFLISNLDWRQLIPLFSRIYWLWLIGALICYFAGVLFRAYRWRFLVRSKKIKLSNSIGITLLYTLFCNALPFRSGELSFIYYLKKIDNISVGEGASVLFLARIFDLLVVSVIFLLTTLSLINRLPNSLYFLYYLAVVIIILVLGVIIYFKKIIRFLSNFMQRSRLKRFGLFGLLTSKVGEVNNFLLNGNFRQIYLTNLILSLIIWLSGLLFISSILQGLNIHLNFFNIVFALSLIQLISFLPIQGFFDFGTYEIGWSIGFVIIGLDKNLAIFSGFASHLVGLVFLLVLSVIWILLSRLKLI